MVRMQLHVRKFVKSNKSVQTVTKFVHQSKTWDEELLIVNILDIYLVKIIDLPH
jgi:hypothetical protein